MRLNCLALDVYIVLSLPCSPLVYSSFSLASASLPPIGPFLLYRVSLAVGTSESTLQRQGESRHGSVPIKHHAPSHMLRLARLPNLDIVALTTVASPLPALACHWNTYTRRCNPQSSSKLCIHTLIVIFHFHHLLCFSYVLPYFYYNNVA